MDYFILIPDKDYSNGPRILNWYGKINTLKLTYGYAHTMPKRTLLYVENNKDLIFTDVILNPFFLVSEETKKVLSIYKKAIPLNQIVLLDDKYEKTKLYYIPFLEEKKLIKKSFDSNNVLYFQEKHESLMREPIFKYVEKDKSYIVIRLDILESLLRRNVNGFMIEPISVRGVDYE